MPPAPRPKYFDAERPTKSDGSSILITGMSGRFPKSNSVKEFMENLYGKVDMLSDITEIFDLSHPEIPQKQGAISNLSSFDANFFSVNHKQANNLDPVVKKMLECTCEALIDAGINPKTLRHRKMGVFTGASNIDSEYEMLYSNRKVNGYGLTGTAKNMHSNRISYWLGLTGPSYTVDVQNACGDVVLEDAYKAIQDGHCDSAIIGGCNLSVFPQVSLSLSRSDTLSGKGQTRSFDEDADGYARADSIVIMILQKAEDAKRCYAEVVHIKSSYTGIIYENERFLYPCGEQMTRFLQEFYGEVNVDPEEVSYIEANGLGIGEVDRKELEGIAEIFCPRKRLQPLMIGSVKSNMGNSQAISLLCSLVKVLMGYHTAQMAPNLHLENPRKDVKAVREGLFQFLTEPTVFDKGYVAINSFSNNGYNSHVLLRNFDLRKTQEIPYMSNIPELVCFSGRVETAMEATLSELESKPVDFQQLALLRDFNETDMSGFMERGYTILKTKGDKSISLAKKHDYYGGDNRPVWFIYSGMGSQWIGMGTQLMQIPIFAKSISRCQKTLDPYNVDLIHILTGNDDKIYDNILNCFLGIAAVQIGLTDVLKEIGIKFDNVIGHSVGEMGCAYADGCLTAEQVILGAYARGIVSNEAPLIKGAMAAVGIGYTQIKSMLPPDIDAACHNSSTSCTISGPAESMTKFVADLTAKGIFAREVPTSNKAYHSRYIAPAGDALKQRLSEFIKDPKLRSDRWISTSAPKNKWDEPSAKYCSAEYLTNNLLSSVLFEEASSLIPSNAITIEIAPHGLLQAIIKRSLSPDCIHVPLARRGQKDGIVFLLESIGKLYMAGLQPKLRNLYPPVQYPVSAETSLLSHTLRWEHSEIWQYRRFVKTPTIIQGIRNLVFTLTDEKYNSLKGYIINGVKYLAPAAQLVMVWETLGMNVGIPYKNLPVEFINVRFDADVKIGDENNELLIMLQTASGVFEIVHNGAAVTTGQILRKKKPIAFEEEESETKGFTDKDVYRMFSQRGFNFRGDFRSISHVNTKLDKANIIWNQNYITFIDGIMQLAMLNEEGNFKPKFIQSLVINVDWLQIKENDLFETKMHASYDPELKKVRCHKIEMTGMRTTNQIESRIGYNTLQQYEFLSFFNQNKLTIYEALRVSLQTVINNINQDLNVIEFQKNKSTSKSIESAIYSVVNSLPTMGITTQVVSITENVPEEWSRLDDANLIVVSDLSKKEKIQMGLFGKIQSQTFILSLESRADAFSSSEYFQLISTSETTEGHLTLLRKVNNQVALVIKKVPENIDNKTEFWKTHGQKTLFVISPSTVDFLDNIQLQRDSQNNQFFIILDPKAPDFNENLPLYKDQIKKGLTCNYYKDGKWGSYYYSTKKTVQETVEHCQLALGTPGDLDSITWMQNVPSFQPKPNSVLVEVFYSRISFSDLIRAQDRSLPGDSESEKKFGLSFSGVTKSGERVMGLVKHGAVASTVEADPDLLWPVPKYWTLEEAATVPQAYVQASYCLIQRAGLKKGMKVLITSGAGAFGQAAINICLAYNCEVFASVTDSRKKRLLHKLYPKIKECNINNSREFSTVDNVLSITNGRGCDIVISTAQGSDRHVLMKCAGPSSKFVDINVEDMEEDGNFGMSFLWMEKTYVAAIFSNIFTMQDDKKTLQKLIYDGIEDGWVRPTSYVSLNADEPSRAFKLISKRRNIGAVLLCLRSETSTKTIINSVPTWKCSEGVYAVVCDKNNLGLEIAEKLISLGANRLFINSQDPNMELFQYKIKCWRQQGIQITILSESVWNNLTCTNFLSNVSNLGPIKGLFFVVSSISGDSSSSATDLKLFDTVSRKICPNLEKFVVVTPLQPLKYGTLFTDIISAKATCEQRSKDGFPALDLQCLSDGNNEENTHEIEIVENMSASLTEALNSLPVILNDNEKPVVAVYSVTQSVEGTILNNVLAIIGLQQNMEQDQDVTLRDLNVSLTMAKAVSQSLKIMYAIFIAPARLLDMTLGELKEVKLCNKDRNIAGGLSMFFSHYDDDEHMASETLIWLPTLASDGDAPMDQYGGDDYLIVVPGMDGHREQLMTLCRRLKVRALFCQHSTNQATTVQELAKYLTQMIITRVGLGKSFYILGYSYGSILALEMANLFENDGLKGKIFCLDGSPTATKEILKSQFMNKSSESMKHSFLMHMCSLIARGASLEGLAQKLENEIQWDAKIEHCLRAMKGIVSNSYEYQKTVINAAWNRIVQTLNYQPLGIFLESEIVLLRAKTSLNLQRDYNLQQLTSAPVKVFDMNSDHATICYNNNITNKVNNELHEDILVKFENSNQCVKTKPHFI